MYDIEEAWPSKYDIDEDQRATFDFHIGARPYNISASMNLNGLEALEALGTGEEDPTWRGRGYWPPADAFTPTPPQPRGQDATCYPGMRRVAADERGDFWCEQGKPLYRGRMFSRPNPAFAKRTGYLGGLAAAGFALPRQDELVAAIRKWNTTKFTARGVLKATESALALSIQNDKFARAFGGPGKAINTDDVRKAAENVRQLTYLRDLMMKQEADPYVFGPGHKTWEDMRKAIVAPLEWVSITSASISSASATSRAALSEAAHVAVTTAMNLPSTIIGGTLKYVAGQIFKLPGWVLPAGLVVGGVMVLPTVLAWLTRVKAARTAYRSA
jgi:hypothetical protein